MTTTTDSANLNSGNGSEIWFGVEAPRGETPLSGSYAMSGDIENLTVLFAGVVLTQFDQGDPGFFVRLRIPNHTDTFTVQCTVESSA